MIARVLVDNNTRAENLKAEWGLAIFIENKGHKFLLDAGTTHMFADNADALSVDLDEAEFGVLSHAHFDHSDGLDRFFEKNKNAKFYLRKSCKENCYGTNEDSSLKYIGIHEGYLDRFADRLIYLDGDLEVLPGVHLLPHKTANLDEKGKAAGMYVKIHGKYQPDSFEHEQSLVVETEKGLVIFNSCSHGGADNIINEVKQTWPDQKIYAYVGGLHLFKSGDEEVMDFAKRVKETGVEHIYTGHCTGERAMELLKAEMGEAVHEFYTGMVIEI